MRIHRERLSSIACPFGLAASFLIMAVISWRRWADILVDFGRELYIPWQISSGSTLYKDLAHLFGPLSQYYHSVLFRLFGVSYTTIIASNMLILLIFLCTLYLLFDHVASRSAAFMSCVIVIFVFAFSQYIMIGNYNFMSPYSHEATHGLVLSLLLICQIYLFQLRKNRLLLFTAGLTLGLVSLTKQDIFFSAALTAGFFFIILATKDLRPVVVSLSALLFLMGFFMPVFAFFSYFCMFMSTSEAMRAVLTSTGMFLKKETVNNLFYIRGMGFDNIVGNLSIMLVHTVLVLGVLYLVFIMARHHATQKKRGTKGYLVTAGLVTVPGAAWFYNPYKIGLSLPALSLLSFIVILMYYINSKSQKERRESDKIIPILLWALFSFLLLAKIILNARLYHYGFYLALPSVVLFVIMTVWFLPSIMEQRRCGGILFRNTMIATLAVIAGHFLLVSTDIYAKKVLPVGSGSDRIITFAPEIDDRGFLVTQAETWIKSHVAPGDSVVVLPEGVMLNYLTRRINPTRYTNLMVPELKTYGESGIIADFEGHSPTYFILVHKNTSEYGVGYFGTDPDNGMKIMTWINAHYAPVALFGAEPFKGKRFGIKILKRNGF